MFTAPSRSNVLEMTTSWASGVKQRNPPFILVSTDIYYGISKNLFRSLALAIYSPMQRVLFVFYDGCHCFPCVFPCISLVWWFEKKVGSWMYLGIACERHLSRSPSPLPFILSAFCEDYCIWFVVYVAHINSSVVWHTTHSHIAHFKQFTCIASSKNEENRRYLPFGIWSVYVFLYDSRKGKKYFWNEKLLAFTSRL